jgi:hypothetical protein
VKRYQECPWYVRTWRWRHYLAVPLTWLYRVTWRALHGYRLQAGLDWVICCSDAEARMEWYITGAEAEAWLRELEHGD